MKRLTQLLSQFIRAVLYHKDEFFHRYMLGIFFAHFVKLIMMDMAGSQTKALSKDVEVHPVD